MNRIILIACLFLVLAGRSVMAQEGIRWQADLARARQAAAQYGVPLMIHFYGDNCLPCVKLEKGVYAKPEVIHRINTYFIPVRINASKDMKTAAEFQIHSWPADVFISPDGKIVARGVCLQDHNAYMQNLQYAAVSSNDHMMLVNASRPAPNSNTAGIAASQAAYGQLPSGSTYTPYQPNGQQPTSPQPTMSQPGTSQPSMPQLQNSQGPIAAFSQPPVQFTPAGASSNWQQNPSAPQPQVYAQSGQFAPQNFAVNSATNSLPAVGQTNAASMLPGSTGASQIAGQLDMSQPTSMLRGPLDAQSQATPLRGAVPGTLSNSPMKISAPNLPSPMAPMQQQYTQQSAMPSQYAAIPAGRAVTVPAQPAALASNTNQPSSTTWTMPNAMPTGGRARSDTNSFVLSSSTSSNAGLTLDNPHYNSEAVATSAPAETGRPTANVSNAVPVSAANPSQGSDSASVSPTAAEPSFQPVANRQESQATKSVSVNSLVSSVANDQSLGLEGYCPVSLNDHGRWVVGEQQFAVKHRGKVYRLSSQETMQKFLASPDAYAPVLSGYDPMVFLDEGKLVSGTFDFGLVEDSQPRTIFLFSSAESKAKFELDFDKNVKSLNLLVAPARSKR